MWLKVSVAQFSKSWDLGGAAFPQLAGYSKKSSPSEQLGQDFFSLDQINAKTGYPGQNLSTEVLMDFSGREISTLFLPEFSYDVWQEL